MKSVPFAVCLAAFIAASSPLGLQAQPQAPAQRGVAQAVFHGLPARLRDLNDLRLLKDDAPQAAIEALADAPEAPGPPPKERFTAPQKTEVLLSWLRAERRDPSPTTTGGGGGPIDSGYIQAQLVKKLEVEGDPRAVEWVLSSRDLKDEGLRDAMRLVLGFKGDRSQVHDLERILLKNPNPDFRSIAAEDLGLLGSASSLPALERALGDEYPLTFASHSHGGEVVTLHPVRQVVAETIRILSDSTVREAQMERGRFFARTAAAMRRDTLPGNMTPRHFVDIANGGKG